MVCKNHQPVSKTPEAARQQQLTPSLAALDQAQIRKTQIRRLSLTRHFLDATDRYASVGEITTATALLIDLIITRYPTAPRFASLLVDRLLVGDEALVEALQEELGEC